MVTSLCTKQRWRDVEELCRCSSSTKWTLRHNANQQNRMSLQYAPLHGSLRSPRTSLATANAHLEVMKLLLHHGTKINTRAANGATAFDRAVEAGSVRCTEILIGYGDEWDIKDDYEEKTLHTTTRAADLTTPSCCSSTGQLPYSGEIQDLSYGLYHPA